MKRILIPVDFSESSFNSCRYAIEIATKEEPVSLWLFHVFVDQTFYNPSTDPDGMMSAPIISIEFSEELRKIADTNMAQLKKQVEDYITAKKYTNFTVNNFMISGDPEWLVEDVCEEINSDGIVMSTSGSGKKSPLEGSMALKIMGRTPVPVVAVPSNYNNFKFNNVLYSTKLDNMEHDIVTIHKMLSLFKHHNFTIYVVHFRKSDNSKVTMQQLEKTFEKERLDEKIRFMLVNDDNNTKTTINAVIMRNNIDLIAFVAHKTNPFKLLFSRGIHKDDFLATDLPVLGLPHLKD
jgi:nucleotide-binding universal stress UspA family protein